jgi:hypothetical protein
MQCGFISPRFAEETITPGAEAECPLAPAAGIPEQK